MLFSGGHHEDHAIAGTFQSTVTNMNDIVTSLAVRQRPGRYQSAAESQWAV
jgi:hypothetical protein